MKPVFFQYSVDNILDQVIDLFVEKGWKSFTKGENLLNHRYIWPDIVLSDRINGSIEDNGVEALGSYTPNVCPEMNGYVTLYVQTIKSIAERFKEDCKSDLSLEEIKGKLSALVLIHEFTHWIIQIGFWRDKIGSLKMKYDCTDSINFHEALAEIVTNYFCSQDPAMKNIFDWLEPKQPLQYSIYNKIFDPTENVVICPAQMNRIIYAVILMQLSKEEQQSYESLKDLYTKLNDLNDSQLICCEMISIVQEEVRTLGNPPTGFLNYSDLIIDYLKSGLDIDKFKQKYKGAITGKKFGL